MFENKSVRLLLLIAETLIANETMTSMFSVQFHVTSIGLRRVKTVHMILSTSTRKRHSLLSKFKLIARDIQPLSIKRSYSTRCFLAPKFECQLKSKLIRFLFVSFGRNEPMPLSARQLKPINNVESTFYF